MNYAGKFGSGSPDNFSSAGLNIGSLPGQGGNSVTIPDAHLLFSGDYSRSGADLIISDQLHRVVVPNYFHGDKRPTLLSPEGAPLDPGVIEALTGHVQYAQAAGTAAAAAAKVVGHVVKMTGSASVVRNGVTVALNNGDNVLQNDVVQTGSGSSLGLVMIDGTTFNLSAGARLMLNDLTYDANSTANASLFTLVQGAASFVAGQVAKTGDMKVGTPVATMGIRGTAVILDISAVDGKVSISVVDQRDGLVHSIQVFNIRGILIGTVTSNGPTLDADADRQLRGDRPGEQQDRRAGGGGVQCVPGAAADLRCRQGAVSGPAAAYRRQSESEYADEICQQFHAGLAQHGVPFAHGHSRRQPSERRHRNAGRVRVKLAGHPPDGTGHHPDRTAGAWRGADRGHGRHSAPHRCRLW